MSSDTLSASDQFHVEVAKEPLSNSNVVVEVFRDGKLIARRTKHNLVMNTGKAQMAKRLVTAPSTYFQFMRLGTNAAAAASGQTKITTAIASSQRTCDTAAMSGTRTAKFIRTWIGANFSASGICEAGIYDHRTHATGVMLARVTFTAVTKTNSDTLKLTWTVKVN